jgi:two-component system, OmpR family, response regulator RegX3
MPGYLPGHRFQRSARSGVNEARADRVAGRGGWTRRGPKVALARVVWPCQSRPGPSHWQGMGQASVLVVDDERKIRELVRPYLERAGYAVLVADSGQQALETVARAAPDLVVLDLMLPDLPGEEVARSLRAVSDVPIIMLTAKASEEDRVAGLRLGADDYLVKPFSPRELGARVEAVLRRANSARSTAGESFGGGALIIDADAREVAVDGSAVALTRSEFDLLSVLASRPGRVWSRYELITRVQGYDHEGYERTVDAHVKNLRRKLVDDPREPRFVVTVTGVGYKLAVPCDG